MRVLRLLVIAFALLIGGVASAEEPKGWLGADVQDVTKAEADKLGWDTPHGAKLGVVASGSPADKAGLKTGDIIVAVDRTMLDTSSEVDAAIAAKRPGAEVRLQVLSGGRERPVTVTLAERPKPQTAEADAKPQLMLDTGGHMAQVWTLAFATDGRQLVTAGEDKVIRVWDWQSGKVVRTIRGQIGSGHEGKVFALALSPNGRWLAVGGWLSTPGERGSTSIRLYDFASGRLTATLKGHKNGVFGLAFSSDGKHLISGSFDLTAMLWDVENQKLIHRLAGHKDYMYGVGFTPDGTRAVTSSNDRTLKLWSVKDGREIATLAGHSERVRALAVSPASGIIASGSRDGEIRLWDSNTGKFLRTLANQAREVGALSFSSDGKWLLSGVGTTGTSSFHCHVWEVATGREITTYTKHNNVVIAAAVSPDGRLIATGSGDGNVHLWNPLSGETQHILASTGQTVRAVGFSADGQRIGWGTETKPGRTANDRGDLAFEIMLPSRHSGLGTPRPIDATSAKAFVRARPTNGELDLAHKKGGAYGHEAILNVTKRGRPLVSIERQPADGYRHSSYTFTPDGQTIVSGGGHGLLIAYNLKGGKLGEFIGHDSEVWAVAPSPDGGLLVSGSSDQTVRLWNLKTRELIVTLFHGTDGEWVMWTPQGYYTGSPGADKIVGWQINKGPENAADYVGAEQLRQHLNRPDIVEKAIILASAEQAVRESPGTTFQLADLLARPVPRFKILSPASGATERGGRAIVKIALEATPDPVKAIRVQVNGRQVEERTPDIGSGGFKVGEEVLDVPLGSGRNEVRITLANAIGDKAETLSLTHEGEGALDKRGTLYILAIGVDQYKGLGNTCGNNGKSSCDLRFSGADAQALVAAVEKRLGPAHNKVVKRVLVNGAGPGNDPTAANILDAIDLLKQATETDTVLLFIAGHGVNDGPDYRFLPTNAELAGGIIKGSTVVQWQVLQAAIEGTKGRRVLFIDTCHAGNAYNQRLGNAAYHANIIAYTAARFDQEAIEDPKLGHGLFTYAVVEGLDGKGGLDAKRQVSTKELAAYVVKRVEELAKSLKGEQEPQYFKGRDAQDYVLARW